MRDKIRELILDLDPDIQELVANVIAIEREYLDSKRPRVKDSIRDQIDKYARESLRTAGENYEA